MSKPSLLKRVFTALWNGLTRLRLALSNLLFLLMLGVLWLVYSGASLEPLPQKAALLLNLRGVVVEERSLVDPLARMLSGPAATEHEVLLRDILKAVELAAADPAITALVMDLDELVYVGISRTQEIAVALEAFRTSGKPIVAIGDYFTQDQYLLASLADEVLVDPIGGVGLEGYSSYRNYFREALAKVSVNMHVFRAGEHKSAVEPFLRDDMSPEEKEITGRWLADLWGQYTVAVEAARDLETGAVNDYVNNFAARLRAQGGDFAETALRAGLVDRKLDRDDSNAYLVDLVGAADDEGVYESIAFERYVAHKRVNPASGDGDARIAVITAQGSILPGEQPPGAIGGDSLAGLIRATAKEDDVRAIVLRIDSGGGSVFASEVIRRELVRVRDTGLPVVVSMGRVAASGGYYIAAQADEIWATPATITGSIGVFAAFPTFEQLLARVGVHTDGVGTTTLAGALRADRAPDPQLVDALNSGVNFTYRSFLDIVADGRDMPPEEVDNFAQGRVWSAGDAQRAGLVDRLGSLQDAIVAAAARAGVSDYEVDYVEPVLSPRELLLSQLADRVGGLGLLSRSALGTALASLLQPVAQASGELSLLQDPAHLYMRCLSCAAVR